ncbi:hypothetical protein ASPZODRAFT_1289662 [Penicilliopsis zonata CBS 506.65]|uniref:Uncharacterized protein n=1 Tax=Penicilliopsis zonata CBS 506.65 TaxID=1073090 RepID=A0A1L9S6A2_9EURO|nr:hypothetical protein ASPZODRAFT_1289662 [Penicilliopsis zonata CBS 506.65]OJJ42691.1 hypothetical protein ASPZODRAFT_1289662 [Penicilliopsis zonata CBS 506.65]
MGGGDWLKVSGAGKKTTGLVTTSIWTTDSIKTPARKASNRSLSYVSVDRHAAGREQGGWEAGRRTRERGVFDNPEKKIKGTASKGKSREQADQGPGTPTTLSDELVQDLEVAVGKTRGVAQRDYRETTERDTAGGELEQFAQNSNSPVSPSRQLFLPLLSFLPSTPLPLPPPSSVSLVVSSVASSWRGLL